MNSLCQWQSFIVLRIICIFHKVIKYFLSIRHIELIARTSFKLQRLMKNVKNVRTSLQSCVVCLVIKVQHVHREADKYNIRYFGYVDYLCLTSRKYKISTNKRL